MSATVVLFTKAPRPGRVKTRLARDIGSVAAAWFVRHQLRRLVARLGRDPRWRLVLAVTPDGAVGARGWPPGPPRQAQGRGDLGARMLRALATQPPGPVVLIGADIPGVTPGAVAAALALAGRHDWVLGPARDGGYWLIGVRHPALAVRRLDGVRWSSPHALADTIAALGPTAIALAATLSDVDTAADLAARPQN